MSRKISEIYTEYKIMPSLAMHMYRVASVASLICDNFRQPINKDEIITACLLHDMGNIIKSNLSLFPEFLEPEGLEYWQKVKDEYIKKYGEDEHKATIEIMKELNISEKIINFVDQLSFSSLCRHRNSNFFDIKIIHYSDVRVDPYGIVSFEERMNEAKKRYKNHKNSLEETERQNLVICGKELEKQIFEHCKIKPEGSPVGLCPRDINDETVKPVILELKDFMVK